MPSVSNVKQNSFEAADLKIWLQSCSLKIGNPSVRPVDSVLVKRVYFLLLPGKEGITPPNYMLPLTACSTVALFF